MFGPTASPVVKRQSTWHIGPTTCVFASRSTAWRDSSGRSEGRSHCLSSGTRSSIQRDSATASPVSRQTKHEGRVIRSATTCVRKPPESSAARAPRCTDAVSPPSVCARGTTTVSSARPDSTTAPSSSSSYSPSETRSCATDTGMTATPVTDSAAFAYAVRSTSPSSPRASRRFAIETGSFFRGSTSAFSRTLRSMAATMIDGRALAAKVREEVARDVAELGHVGLATVLVGDDPASHIYINLKQKAAQEAGMEARDLKLPADTSEEDLLRALEELNEDESVDGILVQLPLPGHLDENAVIEAIDPRKDIDGIHPFNAGCLYLGRPTLVPGTPLGVMRMLDEYEIQLEGARAVVVVRSAIVGKPMAHLLLQRNATVTVCHSRTQDLQRHTLDSDVLVAAVGSTHIIGADMVKAGATVIDVGMTHGEAKKVYGAVDPSSTERAAYLKPVPGGVGPMTIAMVMANTVTAAKIRGLEATTAKPSSPGQ